MKRFLILLGGLAAACGSEVPFEISHNQAPSASCELSDRDTGDVIREGTFDVSIGDRSSYVLTPLVHNRTAGPIEISVARVRVFEGPGEAPPQVRILCEGGEVCDEWDIDACDASGTCPTVPAKGTASFPLSILPRLVTAYYQGQLDTAVREGRVPPEFRLTSTIELIGTTGGAEITSVPFSYTMRFCLGCLVEYPPGSDSPAVTGQDCCGLGGTTTACFSGQDAPIDCRLCSMTSPVICNFGRTSC